MSEYIEELKREEMEMMATYICIPFYMSNFAKLFTWVSPVDGVREWRYPWDAETMKVGFVDAARDTGLFVAGIMRKFQEDPEKVDGRLCFMLSTEFLTPNELCAAYRIVRGKELRYREVSINEFQALLPSMLADLPHQMAMVREFGLYGKDEIEVQPEHGQSLR